MMQYMKALSYIPHVISLLSLLPMLKNMETEDAVGRLAAVLFQVADQATGGLATRTVDQERLLNVVRELVAVIKDVTD